MEVSVVTSDNRRKYERMDREVEIEVRVANFHAVLKSKNISDGGLFLHTDDQPTLPIRTIVRITKEADNESSETILGRIVWISEDGMGIEFID